MSAENELDHQPEQEQQGAEVLPEASKPIVEVSNKDRAFLKESLSRFTNCGRCSLFLAAYRLNHDDSELLASVREMEDEWLSLPWDSNLRSLLYKSYGCRIDLDAYYFESCCPECHTVFVYMESMEDQSDTLRFKM
jgi:hypothetical protein